jgi:hypothetical protein
MFLIAHRGNINGSLPQFENNPDYIEQALKLGFDVEIDIWLYNNMFYLGHDEATYQIDIDWIKSKSSKLWIHCKDKYSLEELYSINHKIGTLNYFWHENDFATITSKGYIWASPGKQSIKNSIAVMPEWFDDDVRDCNGICSDIISKYKIK